MMRRKGFTLIESLAVIAIIGILTTLATTIALGAQRSARDVKRKNDLYAISQGFEARVLDKTCTEPALVGRYPYVSANQANWRWWLVSKAYLANATDCADFSNYLKVPPTDPQKNLGFNYYFNWSRELDGLENYNIARHYRLAASLERSNITQAECDHASATWVKSGGLAYDCATSSGTAIPGTRSYQYHIGK